LLTRYLCPTNCYQDGAVRSCFDHRGRRIADPPAPYVERNEYIEPTITPTDAFADRPMPPRPRRQRRQRTTLASELDRAAQDANDEAALLAAIDQLAAAGRYPEVGTGQGAAGYYGAVRLADLTNCRGRAAAARLTSAGKIATTNVRVLRVDGGDKNQVASGLKRVEGR
jgi:hypothetical protein